MKLADWLKERNVTLVELGRRAGVSHSTIQRIAQGKIAPKPGTRAKLIKATEGQVTDLDLIRWADTSEQAA